MVVALQFQLYCNFVSVVELQGYSSVFGEGMMSMIDFLSNILRANILGI